MDHRPSLQSPIAALPFIGAPHPVFRQPPSVSKQHTNCFSWSVVLVFLLCAFTQCVHANHHLAANTVFSGSPSKPMPDEHLRDTVACAINPFVGILIHTVDPGVIGTNQTICSGSTPATLTDLVTPSPQNIPLTYHWEKSTTSASTGYTIIPATNALTYSPGPLTQPTWFRRAATHTGDTVRTAPVLITVNTPTHNTISADQTICSGATPATLTGPNIAGLFFKWIRSTTSATSGFTAASGTNTAQQYSPGALTQNTWYRRIDSIGTCPPDTTAAVMITVSPPTVGGTVSGGGTFCQGPSYTFLTLSGHTGSIVKWQSSTSPTFASNITDITFTSNPYPATTAQFSSLYYRAIVKSGACPPETSSISPAVVVIQQTVSGQVTGGTTVCTPTNSTTLSLTGNIGSVLKWQSSLSADFSTGVTDISNTTLSLTVTNLLVKTYYRAFVQNGSCTVFFSGKDSISIAPQPSGGIVSGGNTVCGGTNSTTLTLTGYSGTISSWQSSTVRDFSSGVTTLSNTSNTYTALNLTATTYYRAVVSSLTCPSYPVSYAVIDSIVVIPAVSGGTLSGGATVCGSTNSTLLTLTGYSGPIIRWESSLTANFSSGVVTIANTTPTYTATNLTTKTYFRVVLQHSSCPAANSSIDSVVVNPETVGGSISGGGGVCPGPNSKTLTLSGYVGTILKWQSSPVSNFSSGVTDIVNTTNTYTVVNLTATTYYRAVLQNGTCSIVNSSTASIVYTPPVVPGTLSGGNTHCIGTNNTTLTLSGYVGGVTRWESSTSADFSSGVTLITNSTNSLTVTNLSVTTYYRVLVSNSILCPGAYSSVDSIVVFPLSVGGVVSGNLDTVCAGTNSTTFTLSGSTGSIQWQVSTTSATSGFSNILGANSATYIATNLSAKTYYRAIVTSGVCPAVFSAVDSVWINPTSVGGVVAGSNDTVCTGTNSTTFTLTGSTGSIQWQVSTTSATSGFSNIIGANSVTYIANNLSAKTYYRAVVTSGVCPAVFSAVDSVWINPTSVGGVVAGSNDTVCTGTNSTTFTLTGSTGSIQWQVSTTSATSGFSNILGANSATYLANNLSAKTYYRAVVTSGVCPAVFSAVDSVWINPISIGGIVAGSNDTVCTGTNSTTFTLTGSTGSIQWQVSTTSATSGFSNIIGANSVTYIANSLSAKTYYRAVVTSGVCPAVFSAVDSVWINPTSVGGVVAGSNDTVCTGTNSTTFTLTGSTGSIQWQVSTTSATSGFSNILGANSATYLATNLSAKTYYRAVVTSGVCPAVFSAVDSVWINPISIGGIVAGNHDTVCTGTNSTTFTLTGSTGNIQWQVSTTSATSGFSNILGANSATYLATNLSVKTYYRAVVTSGVCPAVFSAVDSVWINPTSLGGVVAGSNDTVCTGTNSTTFTLSGSTGNIQWQVSTTSATSGFSNIIGANSASYLATNLSVKTYYRAVVTSGVCPAVFSAVDSVWINPTSVGGVVAGSNDTVCTGTNSTTFTLTGSTGSIQWQVSTTSATSGFSNILGANSATYIANNLSAKTYYRAVVTSGVCPAVFSAVDSVWVNGAILTNTISGNGRLCTGTSAGILTGSLPTGGNGSTYTYKWISSTTGGAGIFTPAAGINNTQHYSPGILTQHTWFRRIVYAAPCSIDTSNTLMDTVSPAIVYSTAPAALTITYGTTLTLPATVWVTYTDSTSEARPILWDTTGYTGSVGNYTFTGTIQLAPGTCNPSGVTGSYTVKVIPRVIIIKADPKIKPVGTADPPLTYHIVSGVLVGSDTFSGSLSRVPGEQIGKYVILQHTLHLSPNYTLIYLQDSLTITPKPIAISVTKTADTSFVLAGDSITYTIRLKNNGPDTLAIGDTLTVTEQPAPGLTIGTYSPTTGTYTSSNGALILHAQFLPGTYIDLVVRARVAANYQQDSIGNAVVIHVPGDKPNSGDSTDSVFVSTARPIDLGIRKSADRNITQASDTLLYTIVVQNNGSGTLVQHEQLYIRELAPDSLRQLSYTIIRPAGSSYNPADGAFTLGSPFPPGDSIVLTVRGIIASGYTDSLITNRVYVNVPPGVWDSDSTNDSAGVTTQVKTHATASEIFASGQVVCKGNRAILPVSSTGILHPVYTWYADSLLTIPLGHVVPLDTLLPATTTFFVTVKGDNKLENLPGTAKKVTVTVHDYASDTLILTNDTIVCYGKKATLIAKPKGVISNPVFTWYALPSLTIPIATGDTLITGVLTRDTLYYVTIKGSSLCESRELHLVRVLINRNCGNVRLGLAKSVSGTVEKQDGSIDLSFHFVAGNYGDEPLINVKLQDDLKPVFPTAQITVLGITTPGNWKLNTHYDGVTDIELLDTGNRFEVGEKQTIDLSLNLVFPAEDTSTQFKNVAEVSGLSAINGKPVTRKSQDGIQPNPDSLVTDTSFEPTPIVITIRNRPKPTDKGTVWIPNGFSPNGDNDHDLFIIYNPEKYTIYFAVFNRWGNILYENEDYDNSWDGKATKGIIIGQGVPDGTYFYVAEYTDAEGKRHRFAHSLTIVR